VSREKPAVDLAALRIPTCSLSSLLESEALGEFSGVVIDPVTNDVLFDRGMDTLLAPASVQKVLTGVAALNTLGPDTTFQTTTLSTEDPEVLVVKAGGDLTLSATPEGQRVSISGQPSLLIWRSKPLQPWKPRCPRVNESPSANWWWMRASGTQKTTGERPGPRVPERMAISLASHHFRSMVTDSTRPR
jgi:hypothetical protein